MSIVEFMYLACAITLILFSLMILVCIVWMVVTGFFRRY